MSEVDRARNALIVAVVDYGIMVANADNEPASFHEVEELIDALIIAVIGHVHSDTSAKLELDR